MGWWHDRWTTESKPWICHWLDPGQDKRATARAELPADQAYLSIVLSGLHVPYIRQGWKRFYGVVDGYSTLPYRGAEKAAFHVITTPSQLKDKDPKHLDRLIPLSFRLLGPIPYRGGDLEVEIGLFSVKTENLLAPYLSLLEQLGSTAGVSIVSTALPFVNLITSGIEVITGTEDQAALEVGISGQFIPVTTGRLLVMRIERSEIDPTSLRVDADGITVLTSGGKTVIDAPYMLLDVSATKERADWFSVPDLAAAYRQLGDDVRKGDFREVSISLRMFQRAAMTSPDLLHADAKRIGELVSSEVHDIMGSPIQTGAGNVSLRSLADYPLYEDLT